MYKLCAKCGKALKPSTRLGHNRRYGVEDGGKHYHYKCYRELIKRGKKPKPGWR
jgi:hypothetical protein